MVGGAGARMGMGSRRLIKGVPPESPGGWKLRDVDDPVSRRGPGPSPEPVAKQTWSERNVEISKGRPSSQQGCGRFVAPTPITPLFWLKPG